VALVNHAAAPVLFEVCAQRYDLNIRYRYLAGQSLNYQRRDVSEEHSGILDATVAQDADRASALLLDHYRTTGAYLSGLLGEGALDMG